MGSSAAADDESSRGKWKIRKRWNSLPFSSLLSSESESAKSQADVPWANNNSHIRIQEDSVRVRSSRLEVAIHFRETEV